MEKRCFKCGRIRLLSEFYTHPGMADGHLNKCKDCCRSDTLQNRRRKTDYYRAYDRNRSYQPHRVILRKATWRRQKEMEPEKYKARTAAGNAIRDGRLPRGTECYFCGKTENLEMHHPDYSQPLRVYWLCQICHRKLDGMLKVGIRQNQTIN